MATAPASKADTKRLADRPWQFRRPSGSMLVGRGCSRLAMMGSAMHNLGDPFDIVDVGDIGLDILSAGLDAVLHMLAGFQGVLETLSDPLFGVGSDGFGQLEKASGLILRQHRRSTAMIFQSHQLIGRFSVLENVLIGCLGKHSSLRTLLPLSRKEIKNALGCLDRLEILDKANERVDNLSGGQRQRVGIARGLVQNPRIMLADEPVASLDPVTSEKTLKLMKTICKEDGLTAIVSLHQLDLAIRFADRIVALCKGRVIYDGLPESLDNTHIEKIYRSKESQPAGESTTYGTSEKHAA